MIEAFIAVAIIAAIVWAIWKAIGSGKEPSSEFRGSGEQTYTAGESTKVSSDVRPGDDVTIIDVETSGLDPQKHCIVQIGVVRIEDGGVAEEWSANIKPFEGSVWSEDAERVHGITKYRARKYGVPFESIVPRLKGLMRDNTLLAHNAEFDGKFVGLALARAGEIEFARGLIWLCTMIASREIWEERGRGTHTLDRLKQRLGIRHGRKPQHDALDDAQIVAKIWLNKEFGQKWKEVEEET